jgi:spore germination protein KC
MNKHIVNKHRKAIVISYIIISCFIMTACFSYKDINKVIFVTAIIIDVDENDMPVLYAEAFKGTRSATPEGVDQRVLFKGTGKTIFEAVRDMNAVASYKINYTQNKAIIFTQKAAEAGVDNFIDFLDRDQELLIRPYIAVYIGDPEKLMKLSIIQERYIGILLMQMLENIGASSRAVKLSLNDFYNQRAMGDRSSVVTVIDIKKDTLEPKIEVNGGAVIKNDRMVSRITREEGQGFNFLMNSISGGTLEITNPNDINKFITLEIKGSRTKTQISYNGDTVNLKKKVKVSVDLGEAQKRIILTKESIEKIQQKSEDNIVKACNDIFAKYKRLGIDIFDITEKLYAKYPKAKTENIINKTELKVEVEVEIMNTGDVRNFE